MVSSRGELFRRNPPDETLSGKTQRPQSDASPLHRPEMAPLATADWVSSRAPRAGLGRRKPLLNLSMVEKPWNAEEREPKHRAGRLNQTDVATFLGSCALRSGFNRGNSVAGNGSIGVGAKTRARGPGRPAIENVAGTGVSGLQIAETNFPRKQRPKVCVAMTQQSGEFGRGNQSAPQKLPQLVGCRDPKARLVPWVRPRPLPAKQ
jgi:hypothetical protein